MYDQGNEFLGHAFKNDLIEKIISNQIQVWNYIKSTREPNIRNNSLSHFKPRMYVWIKNDYLDEDDSWSFILAATGFAVRSM